MPDVAEQPTKPPRTWRPMALWTAGILLALGLAWFIGAVVVPVWQVRSAVARWNGKALPRDIVRELGGPRDTARYVALYVRSPHSVAADKSTAVELLGFCGGYGVPLLARQLASDDRAVVNTAIWSLGLVLDEKVDAREALPGLVQCLSSSWPETRCAAAEILGRFGRQEEWVRSALRKALVDRDLTVAVTAARSLRQMLEGDAEIFAVLCRGLSAEDPALRRDAVIALGWCPGAIDEPTAKLMIGCLDDRDEEVRIDAAIAVDGIAPQFPGALAEAYRRAQKDSLKMCLIYRLRAAGSKGVPYLCEALGDRGSPAGRLSAARRLGEMGQCASDALPSLKAALGDESRLVREAAQEAIAKIEAAQEKRPEPNQSPVGGSEAEEKTKDDAANGGK